jgi:hypothetical protein
MSDKMHGDAETDQAHRAIEKLTAFAEAAPEHAWGCPWCRGNDHWAGRVELCSAPSSRAIAEALRHD